MEALRSRLAREARFYRGLLRMLRRIRVARPDSHETLADIIETQARLTPGAPAIYFEDRILTYDDWNRAANRVARWALEEHIRRGETVAILMENRPEFLIAWTGLAKIGAVGALLNTSQSGEALAHSLDISHARHLILGAELSAAFQSVAGRLRHPVKAWALGGHVPGTEDLDVRLAALQDHPVDRSVRAGLTGKDTCFLVYTSGTTGLPKAALISHARVFLMMNAFSALANAKPTSRMYIPLPLYHTSGGICAVGAVATVGGSLILRRKFSVHGFWEDCARYRATHFIYIGELCRYLLNAPPQALERAHTLQTAIGNGLRPEVWEKFKARFNIPEIVEFYGATEGNVSLFNFDGRPGAVGRIPRFMKRALHMRLVAIDLATEQPVRGADGLCVECRPGEAGEAIGRISEKDTRARFEGYTAKADTERKVLSDVFKRGDRWFRTGDLLRQDTDGYFYFVDRIGDTFRWKGENVATCEVSKALASVPGIKEANVYGVPVPGTDGKAGMAAIHVESYLDMDALADRLVAMLAPYARPVFLRVKDEIDDGHLQAQENRPCAPRVRPQGDARSIFVHDAQEGRCVPLDEEAPRRHPRRPGRL
ncbi:MAG: long-chain-acyl-CoA synthetase [Alphaproteobacteria bacterium]